ncbi:WXG100 family type VII secretion target [Saccharomonospora azurea]
MSDPLGGISIKSEPTYGEQVVDAIPYQDTLSGGKDLVRSAWDSVSDGQVTAGELGALTSDGADFVSSCKDIAQDFALDPIGTLVGQGLDFLISICQPLQDLIHLVSGDGAALQLAAENFGSIGEGINEFGQQFVEEADRFLAGWQGPASDAAAAKLAEFAKGIRGVAGEAGNIAQLLHLSSIVMTVIEEFIIALLTEFITWLVMIWVPALAAAGPTFGGSTAAAGSATAVRSVQTTSTATQKVNWLRRLLDKIKAMLGKLRDWMGRQAKTVREAMEHKRSVVKKATDAIDNGSGPGTWSQRLHHAENGMVGQRVDAGFGKSMRQTATDHLSEKFGVDSWSDHVENVNTGLEYGEIGEDQSASQTSRQLDL